MESVTYTIEGMLIEVDKPEEKPQAQKLIAIRAVTGMNRSKFAEWLGVPYRTMQDWELGVSKIPEYVLNLIAYKVANEREKGKI